MQLAGKTAIITGGGRGIGRAIAIAFAREGADICVMSRSQSELDDVAAELRQIGRKSVATSCDVSDFQSVQSAIDRAAGELDKIDILVNCAGGGEERKNVGEDSPEVWSRVIEINLNGTYYCSRAVLPYMKKQGGGSIINVGSGMGHQARTGNSSYNAAKAGVWMLTRCLAMEVWQDGILVNELIPGPVHTNLTAGIFEPNQPHPSIDSEWVKPPEDVAPLAVFLANQAKNGPTGQSFSLARRPF